MKFWLGSILFLLVVFIVDKLAFGDIVPPHATTAASADDATKALGRHWTEAFYRGDLAAFWQQLDDKMRGLFGSLDEVGAFRSKVLQQAGKESSIESETVTLKNGARIYVRHAHFDHVAEMVEVQLAFDAHDRILGFRVQALPSGQPAPSTKLDYRTKTPLRLPFDGTWAVAWGGRTLAENHHASNREQRFAYDLLVVQADSTHAGDGKRNSDYYCYGRAILAPGAGTVVAARNDVAENVPGVLNSKEVAGNHVIIDHGNGEFSFLAHLIPGSVTVHSGDRVTAGQLLGKCGNSGHSSEPHLHYHLQTTANLFDGDGLPAQFTRYFADGKPVVAGEPTHGQLISTVATK
jgi:murein DD-endopeptidase MepM/ murein hydrolase activator NlpD